MSNMDITVYDDIFSWTQRDLMYDFIIKSKFIIDARDIIRLESTVPNIPFLISEWNEDDISRFGIFRYIENNKELIEQINSRSLIRCFVNLDTGTEVHHIHNHPGQHVLLYQANMEWNPEWYGETFFYDDNKEDVVQVNSYTPGRLIWFNGEIPHSFRPPSRVAPYFRFTVSFFFE